MEKNVKITTGRSLSAALDKIVSESIKASLYNNSVEEKEKQSAASIDEEDDDLFGDDSGGDKKDEPAEDKPTSSKTVDDETEKLKKGDVKASDVVEKLNSIRAGKSFKDEAISNKLSEYVDSLSKAEKVALLAFLKGIAQIVTGEIEPDVATDPADTAPDVAMTKGDSVQKKTLKPNVIKAPGKDKKKSASSEDTSAPAPITPVKSKSK